MKNNWFWKFLYFSKKNQKYLEKNFFSIFLIFFREGVEGVSGRWEQASKFWAAKLQCSAEIFGQGAEFFIKFFDISVLKTFHLQLLHTDSISLVRDDQTNEIELFDRNRFKMVVFLKWHSRFRKNFHPMIFPEDIVVFRKMEVIGKNCK